MIGYSEGRRFNFMFPYSRVGTSFYSRGIMADPRAAVHRFFLAHCSQNLDVYANAQMVNIGCTIVYTWPDASPIAGACLIF